MKEDIWNNSLFKSFFDSNPFPAMIFSMESGKILTVNSSFIKLYGYSNEDISGLCLNNIRPKAEVDYYMKVLKSLKPGGNYSTYAHHKTKDNKNLCVNIHMYTHELGDQLVAVVIMKDITEQMEIQNRLESAEVNYNMLINYSLDLIIILTQDGKFKLVSPASKKLLGYSPDEMTGRSIYDFADRNNYSYINLFLNNLQLGKSYEGQFLFKKRNGEKIYLKGVSSMLPDVENAKLKIIMVLRDNTEKKILFDELAAAQNKNEDIEQLKTIILTNMNHEFRTPLVGILGYAEILENEITDHELKEMLDVIRENGERLLTSLNMIINLSALEAGNIKLFKTKVDLSVIVLKVINKCKSYADKKKLYIKLNPKQQNFVLRIDKDLLHDALFFIIDNGIKYTEMGGLTINIDYCTDGQKKCCKIEIIDTGIGIPENKQKIIFEAFRQISEGNNRTFEGLGLGLTVAQKIINMIGGEIKFTSTPRKGTTFALLIPVEE